MSKYFRLAFFCRFVAGENGGCIYNMHSGEMLAVETEETELLKKTESNQKVDEKEPFLQELIKLNMGEFYDNQIFTENSRAGAGNEISEIMKPVNQVKRIFIQLTNECDCDCIYCDNSNEIYTKTRCKKWNNENAEITLTHWKEILNDARLLGAEGLCFIGGNPILEWERLFEIVEHASKIGFHFFIIYTNMNYMNHAIINLCQRFNVMIRAQIHSLVESEGREGFTNISSKNVIKNLQLCNTNGISVIAEILITRYNENDIEKTKSVLNASGISNVTLGYLYDRPENNHYSKKYINEMYKKHFGEISRESITFYENYNSCLFGQISINISGNVTPCPMMNGSVMGNIGIKPLYEIINNDTYVKLTKASRSKMDKCNKCSYRLNCIDCRAIESAATGNLFGTEFCEIQKKLQKETGDNDRKRLGTN